MESTRILIYLLAIFCLSNALSSVEVAKAKKDEEIYLRQMYVNMDKGIKNLIRDSFKSIIRAVQEKSQEFNISPKCKENAFRLLLGIRNLQLWALNFIDATGKPGDGILTGNGWTYGNYDQCLNSSALKRNGAVDFRGKYCLITITAHLPNPELTPDAHERLDIVNKVTQNLTEGINLYARKSENIRKAPELFGVCVPSGCETTDIEEVVKYVRNQIFMNVTLAYCETEDSLLYFTPSRIVVSFIYAFFILLVIISSVIDRYSTVRKIQFENPLMKSVLCFSLQQNFQKFMNTKVSAENHLSFLNGIRVLCLFHIILSHHFLVKGGTAMSKNALFYLMSILPRINFQILVNGNLVVDIFFFIGGFLHLYVRAKTNMTSFSLVGSFKILIHRLIRIYPVYIFVILLVKIIHFRGPLRQPIEKLLVEPCDTVWWKNIIFINNIYHPENQCIPHSWYIAADTQLFLVALFTIPLLFRNPKIGVLVNLAIILLSTTYTTVRFWIEDLILFNAVNMETLLSTNEKDGEDIYKLYASPFPHVAPYFGGVLLAFFFTKRSNLKLSKIALVFGSIVASMMFLIVMLYPVRWNNGYTPTRVGKALYFSMSKILYSWSIGWIIFCCLQGHGGFITRILSWKLWIPLNRLCLSAYLLSAVVQVIYFGNLRTTQEFQHNVEIWGYFGDLTVTILTAIPMVLLFEFPFIALEKVIFHKKENASEPKEVEMNGKEIFKPEIGLKK